MKSNLEICQDVSYGKCWLVTFAVQYAVSHMLAERGRLLAEIESLRKKANEAESNLVAIRDRFLELEEVVDELKVKTDHFAASLDDALSLAEEDG